MAQLICLFGGTFDPVHYGHLKPLYELKQKLRIDQVFIVPASVPPHRPAPGATSKQRLHMLKLALTEFPGFVIDTRELNREGPSWMVVTLQSFRKQYPNASLCLVMGSDAFHGLPSWYHWQEIPELANIIVIRRAGQEHEIPGWANNYLVSSVEDLHEKTSSCVLPVSLTGYDISATQIRRKVSSGESVTGDLPVAVIEYIEENGLYRDVRLNEKTRGR
jgi:nicotinate-nucleotide adenylyltransferase